MKNTSAGEWAPSVDELVGQHVLVVEADVDTLMPVFFSNAFTRAWVVCTCWPL